MHAQLSCVLNNLQYICLSRSLLKMPDITTLEAEIIIIIFCNAFFARRPYEVHAS